MITRMMIARFLFSYFKNKFEIQLAYNWVKDWLEPCQEKR